MNNFVEIGKVIHPFYFFRNFGLFSSAINVFKVIFYGPYLGTKNIGRGRKDFLYVGAVTS